MKALCFTLVVAVALLLGFPSGTMANPPAGKPTAYHYTVIADTSGPFREIRPYFSINNRGTVSFSADLKAGDGGGIFTGDGGSIATVVYTRPSFYLGTTSISEAGAVAFDAWPVTAPIPGIYIAKADALTPIVTSDRLMGYSFVSLNNSRAVAYRSAANLIGEDAIWLALPGAEPTQLGSGLPPSINDQGTVVFVARLDYGIPSNWAVVASHNGGPLTRVADTLSPLGPGSLHVAINNNGTVAYTALLRRAQDMDPGRGVVTVSNGHITTVADNSGPFSGFGQFLSINNRGVVAFEATLRSGASGIFTGPDPVADKVIAQGDPLLGATVTKVDSYSREGLNDRGEVVFLATLSDGRQVLVRARPENCDQEPGAAGAALAFPL